MEDKTPKYGKVRDKIVLDTSGSTMTEDANYRDGKVVYPKRRDYEYRHPCDTTDLATISKIAQDLMSDDTKLDAALRFETRKSNGIVKHYVVECYTRVIY